MTRLKWSVACAAMVLGCSATQSGGSASAAPTDQPVKLLTGEVPGYTVGDDGQRGCYTFAITGELVADPEYGTVVKRSDGSTVPVMWSWPGISARRAGPEVEVLVEGKVVATTGRSYTIPGGYHDPGFVACDPLHLTPQ